MSQDQELSLTIGDKINWPFILANSVLKFQESIVRPEGQQSEQQVREASLVFYYSIPSSWLKEDEQFQKDREKCFSKRKIDARPLWCGQRVGPPNFEDEEIVQPYRLYNACVDVLNRRGMIGKKEWTEVFTGKHWTKEDTDAITTDPP